MKNKKGADLSMNLIIVAALALLVLVTVSLIFIGRTNTFNKQAKGCESAGGTCVDTNTYANCREYADDRGYDAGSLRSDLECYNPVTNKKEQYKMCCVLVS
jgi:hypothetical protein